MRRNVWSLLVVLCWLAPLESARAQPASEARIQVRLPGCRALPFELGALRNALVLELSSAGRVRFVASDASTTGPDAPTNIRIEAAPCDAEAPDVTLHVRHGDAETVQRTMGLADVAREARPRAVALACRELLQAIRTGRAAPRPQSNASTHPPPSAKMRAARPTGLELSTPRREETPAKPTGMRMRRESASEEVPRQAPSRPFALSLMATGWGFSTTASAAAGAGLSVELPWREQLVWDLGADLAFSPSRPLEDAAGTRGQASYAFVAASAGLRWRPWKLASFGARLYAGYAWGEGTSERPDVSGAGAREAIMLATLVGRLRIEIIERWWGFAELEAGYALLGLTLDAPSGPITALGGAIGTLRIGMSWRF